ncbi:MAG: hypothetical protein Kow0031_31090 [Anaerolineae bacterium]
MDHFIEIYRSRAADYHRMITPEDVEGNLLPAIERVAPVAGRRVLDVGTGTGRLPLLFEARPAQVVALDLHADMLREHNRRRGGWSLLQADARRLPLPAAGFGLVTAGWAIGHMVGWYGDEWPVHIGRALAELHRVAAPGAGLVIMETLGTGSLSPSPPAEGLAHYYAWLEGEWGFERQEIATDYQFGSVAEAVAATRFFFGEELAAQIEANGWSRLPEWTGVWGKRI